MPRRSLRARVLFSVVVGVCLLAVINIAITTLGLLRVQDYVARDSTTQLREQAQSYLQRVVRERAARTSDTLKELELLAATLSSLAQAPNAGISESISLLEPGPQGYQVYHGPTTVLFAGAANEQLAADLADSAGLDLIMPDLARQFPQVVRISYHMPSGLLRSYPRLDPASLAADWTVLDNPTVQMILPQRNPTREVRWSPIHHGLDDPHHVISVAAPVYRLGIYRGAIVVDTSLEALTGYLEQLTVEQDSFAMLIDSHTHLLATPEHGQRQLFGHLLRASEFGQIDLSGDAALRRLIQGLSTGRDGSVAVELDGRPYLLAYAPVQSLGWSLALATPLDEITSRAEANVTRIRRVVRETGLLAVLAALCAVAALAGGLQVLLNRQFVRPLDRLMQATRELAAGRHTPIYMPHQDELGQLATAFNGMTDAVERSRADIIAANQQLEQKVQDRTAELERLVAELGQASDRQRELLETLQSVSTPIIPLAHGVIAMPLIGQFDRNRAAYAIRELLARIERDRASTVLLDVTGLAMVDYDSTAALVQVVSASRLLGARLVLVGVSPEIAQALVAQGTDLRELHTVANMRTAIEQILLRRVPVGV